MKEFSLGCLALLLFGGMIVFSVVRTPVFIETQDCKVAVDRFEKMMDENPPAVGPEMAVK